MANELDLKAVQRRWEGAHHSYTGPIPMKPDVYRSLSDIPNMIMEIRTLKQWVVALEEQVGLSRQEATLRAPRGR